MQEKNIGRVVQVIGPVLDIRFPNGHLPDLLNAIEIEREDSVLVCEVAQQLGDDVVRCIAMSSTDGMMRGMEAVDTGTGIKVPVGKETLGRVFNLLGKAIDNKPQPSTVKKGASTATRQPKTSTRAPRRCLKRASRSSI